jgi:hypothetical protein
MGVYIFAFSGCLGSGSRVPKGRLLERRVAETRVLPSSVSEKKQHSPSAASKREAVLITVSFSPLEDKRPKADISYMTSIRERTSDEVLRTLRNLELFDEINSPANADDVIVISGEIRKFNWESYNTIISYVPGLNVLPFFGLPSTRSYGVVEIYLEIKNNKTGEVILEIDEFYGKNRTYSMYSFKAEKANEELAYCFDVVLNKIKEKILAKKNEILAAIKPVSSKISRPAEKAKAEPAQISESIEEMGPEPARILTLEQEVQPEESPKAQASPEGEITK